VTALTTKAGQVTLPPPPPRRGGRVSRRRFLQAAAGAALMTPPTLAAAAAGRSAGRRPNFIFILTDDQGWHDAAAFGHPYLKTPNLDRLAKQSARFTQFYTASPVCSPSRCGFMTSHYPARHQIHGHFATEAMNRLRHMPDFLDPSAPFLPRQLKDVGYRTGHFGKWHLGSGPDAPTPAAYGIDAHRITVSDAADEDDPPNAYDRSDDDWPAHLTRWIVDDAIAFLREHRDQPFYLNVWSLIPHAPLRPTAEQLAVYDGLDPRADDPAFGRWMRDYLAGAEDLTSQMKTYCAAMTDLDTQVGRLLDELNRLRLADDTVVVFSADNGPEDYRIKNAANAGVGSTGPLRARKRSVYEGGVRTPLLVRWPGRVEAGRVDEASVIGAVDFLPTVLSLAGVEPPKDLAPDGEDVSDIWLGEPRERRGPLHWEWLYWVWGGDYLSPLLAIREGKWKLLLNPDRSRIELYDIPADPAERHNLADQHPKVVDRLAAAALAWHQTLPPNPDREGWTGPFKAWEKKRAQQP